jgi:hypothetical protein
MEVLLIINPPDTIFMINPNPSRKASSWKTPFACGRLAMTSRNTRTITKAMKGIAHHTEVAKNSLKF